MKLYIYDHCPFCNKARIAAGILNSTIEEITVQNGDVKTPTDLVGKKVVPILIKQDGEAMPESMDIVAYLLEQSQGEQTGKKLTSNTDEFIENWLTQFTPLAMQLTIPRCVLIDFAEFQTQADKDYFINAKHEKYGDFTQLIAKTPEILPKVTEKLQELEEYFIKTNYFTNIQAEEFNYSDINLYAFLRLSSIVKGLAYPKTIEKYMQKMQEASKLELLPHLAV